MPGHDSHVPAFIIGKSFIGNAPCALVLGDNIFYGHSLIELLNLANARKEGATIFAYHVNDPENYGVAEFDKLGQVTKLEEKPKYPKSNFVITGLYFYDNKVVEFAKKVKPSNRGELEITSINQMYLEQGDLNVELLGRGFAWLDTGTQENLLDAAIFVASLSHIFINDRCTIISGYRLIGDVKWQ